MGVAHSSTSQSCQECHCHRTKWTKSCAHPSCSSYRSLNTLQEGKVRLCAVGFLEIAPQAKKDLQFFSELSTFTFRSTLLAFFPQHKTVKSKVSTLFGAKQIINFCGNRQKHSGRLLCLFRYKKSSG